MAKPFVAVAGITGGLGKLVGSELRKLGVSVKGLVRPGTDAARTQPLQNEGVEIVPVNFNDGPALTDILRGGTCVVSTLQGLEDVVITAQGKLLAAAVSAKVPRFIPSDFALDFTKTKPGSNRNLDWRRQFHAELDKSGIAWTSILNGAFMDMLEGEASTINNQKKKIIYIGDTKQPWDYTTMRDVAAYTAAVAIDERPTPKFLRIAGDVATPEQLAATVSKANNANYKLSWMGSPRILESFLIPFMQLFGGKNDVFPMWQGLQYAANMASGDGKLDPLDNNRYPAVRWTTITDFLNDAVAKRVTKT